MSEIRFLTSSDEHLADLSPGYRKDDYRSAILSKLEWQGVAAKKFRADAILRGGDFFHSKAANKTTMGTLALAADIHTKYPCPTFSLVGNHDMNAVCDPDSVPRQPIGVLLHSNVFRRLRDETFQSGSMRVRVVGVDYTVGMEDGTLHEAVKKRGDETYLVAFVHALASFAPDEKIQSFFNERIFDYRDLVFEGCPDVYVFGHYHKDQGVREHLGVKFVNLGAVSRGALTFENLERKPKVSLIRFDSRGSDVEEVVIPHTDALQAFDLERKKQLDAERKSLADFLTQIRSGSEVAEKGGDIRSRLEELKRSNIADDIKQMVEETLEAAESGALDDS